jgi:type II secretory pathway pseudopilin PulG
MMVAAIIGLLASIALPKFGNMIRKSREASTLGNLGCIRSALTIYYVDTEGYSPYELATLTEGGKYLSEIPRYWTYEHSGGEVPYDF